MFSGFFLKKKTVPVFFDLYSKQDKTPKNVTPLLGCVSNAGKALWAPPNIPIALRCWSTSQWPWRSRTGEGGKRAWLGQMMTPQMRIFLMDFWEGIYSSQKDVELDFGRWSRSRFKWLDNFSDSCLLWKIFQGWQNDYTPESWNIHHLKMHFLLKIGIFQCHVSLQGCIFSQLFVVQKNVCPKPLAEAPGMSHDVQSHRCDSCSFWKKLTMNGSVFGRSHLI